jgi:outer membrane immunogenic protein
MRQSILRAAILGSALIAMPALAEPFSGPYAGAQLGWQQDRFSARLTEGGTTLTDGVNNDGFSYGAFLGYNHNLNGKGIIGIEGVVGGSTNSLSDDEEETALNSGRTFEIVGRAGALISPKTLVYGRAGYANARYTVPADIGNLAFTQGGWIAGVGIDHAFTDSVSGRVEYNYSKFGSVSYDLGEGDSVSVRPSRNAVRAGVTFHF